MSSNNLHLIFAIVLCCCFSSISGDCVIKYGELPVQQPLFLSTTNKLLEPTSQGLITASGKIKIACTGINHKISGKGVNNAIINCVSEETFQWNGVNYKMSDLICDKPNTATIKTPPTPLRQCGRDGKGEIKKVALEFNNEVLYMFDICYDMSAISAIYTHNIIKGSVIGFRTTTGGNPSFNDFDIPLKNPNALYKPVNQKDWLKQDLGSEEEANKYVSSKVFLNKGHLTPSGDGILISEQRSTYYFLNVAPQWTNINGASWSRIEENVRNTANILKADVDVFTGAFGILTLPNQKGHQVPINLQGTLKTGGTKNIGVPKWFWKIIKHGDSGIAFLTLNNPYFGSESPCPNICDQNKWDAADFKELKKGLTFCCTVSNLMQIVPDIPDIARVKNILKNPARN